MTVINRLLGRWYYIVVFAILVFPVWYAAHQLGDEQFWDGAFGNWLATMLGVIAGVPVAFEIDRWRLRQEEERRNKEAGAKSRNVLMLLKDELETNLSGLERREGTSTLPRDPLGDSVWSTFSASGDIQWIEDTRLLQVIAQAYHYVRIVVSIEERCFHALRGVNVKYDDGTFASQRLFEDARAFDGQLKTRLRLALDQMEEAIALGSGERRSHI